MIQVPSSLHHVLLFLQIAVATTTVGVQKSTSADGEHAESSSPHDADSTMDSLIEQAVIDAISDGEYDHSTDDDLSNTPFHIAYDEMPKWCSYSGTDAFKIVLLLSIFIVPVALFSLAYSFRLWRAKIDVARMYMEKGMSVRGTVVSRKAKRRKDYEGRTYHTQEIVVEYDPIFVGRFVEENGNEDEIDEHNENERMLTGYVRCSIVYRKRLRVSRSTFHAAAFGSIRLLVLDDSRSAYPAREIATLQRNSGVCWVWCFGLLLLASLFEVAVNATCARLWYCWMVSVLISVLVAFVASQCTIGVYKNFVDSIVVGKVQEFDKNERPISKQGDAKLFTRLTRIHSEPVGTTTGHADEVKCSRSQSEHFVVACPLVKI